MSIPKDILVMALANKIIFVNLFKQEPVKIPIVLETLERHQSPYDIYGTYLGSISDMMAAWLKDLVTSLVSILLSSLSWKLSSRYLL